MRGLLTILIFAQAALGCRAAPERARPLPKVEWKIGEGPLPQEDELQRGRRPADSLARRPQFKRPAAGGLRCNADGSLGEWRAASWIDKATPLGATGTSPASQSGARLALASYSGGLSLAITAKDASHLPAKAVSMFGQADAVLVELTPAALPEEMDASLFGVRFWLGTFRALVHFEKPAQRWRDGAVGSFGAEVPGGWQIEARIPLSTLTPLPEPQVARWRYRVTVYDADGAQKKAVAALRFEGEVALDPAPEVHEAVRRRLSVRSCMAAHPGKAVWGFRNGWRCSVPYETQRIFEDDAMPGEEKRTALSHARMPDPPMLRFLRERVVLLNYPGIGRGLAALVKADKTLLSLLDLGVVGARSPGNALTKQSEAESLRLPDGTWAFSVVHAYPEHSATARALGARCEGGQRVFLSIVAVRGAPHVTPHKAVPEPEPPPTLEEVLRVQLAGCKDRVARRWRVSRDAREVKVYDSLYPRKAARRYVYRKGAYRQTRGGGA